MEKARQHPALGQERRLFLALIFLGLLAPFVGLALQLGFGGFFLIAGMLTFALSRVATEMWQLLRPALTQRRKNKAASIFSILIWIILISFALFYLRSMP